MEKSFEHTDFFFTPSNLLPYGIGRFKITSPGVVNDPLQNLAVNPAWVKVDSGRQGYFYVDFRSARTITEEPNYYIMPMYSSRLVDAVYMPFPRYYLKTRRELEPVFSGAFLGLPFPETLPNVLIGASYQLLLQDEKYYDVPQDIYRSVLGSDYAGNRMTESSLPTVDRYSGEDKMQQKGHLISFFSRYEFPSIGSVGIKIGRVLFDRTGEIGSSNLWSGYTNPSIHTSLWSNNESREQEYDHWEITGGTEFYLNNNFTVGLTAGYLWGTATQVLQRADSSRYDYPSSSYSNYYTSSSKTKQDWKHDGGTNLYGFDATWKFSQNLTLRFLYQRLYSSVDLKLGSAISDTSYSRYSSLYNDTMRTSIYNYYLRDRRNGSGEQTMNMDRALVNVNWRINGQTELSVGVQFNWTKREINTTEKVLADMASYSQSDYYGYYSWQYGSEFSKDMHWNFLAEDFSFHIPVFINIQASDVVSFILGLNRTMVSTNISEVTLVENWYNQNNSNGTITRRENYAERYTTPKVTESDVRTTFLAGITVTPAKEFSLRLQVVPNFKDYYDGSKMEGLQWWISLKILL